MSQKQSQRFQRVTRCVARRIGNVNPQASNPFDSVKLANTARRAQRRNLVPMEKPLQPTQSPQTMHSAGTKEGKPEASSHNSCCAGEKISSTISRKAIVV